MIHLAGKTRDASVEIHESAQRNRALTRSTPTAPTPQHRQPPRRTQKHAEANAAKACSCASQGSVLCYSRACAGVEQRGWHEDEREKGYGGWGHAPRTKRKCRDVKRVSAAPCGAGGDVMEPRGGGCGPLPYSHSRPPPRILSVERRASVKSDITCNRRSEDSHRKGERGWAVVGRCASVRQQFLADALR